MRDTPLHTWLQQRLAEARQAGWAHVDVLCDLANGGPPWEHTAACTPQERVWLLHGTPHPEAVDEGPMLSRYRLSDSAASQPLINELAQTRHQQRLLVLHSSQPFALLAAQLRYFTQASWDQGCSHGILRYYNPLLLRHVMQALDEGNRTLLLGAASQWHWLDRDDQAQVLLAREQEAHWQTPDAPLQLSDSTVGMLANWHESELYIQRHRLNPAQLGCQCKEDMVQKVYAAQLAADAAQAFGQAARQSFIAQYLATA